MKKLKNSEGSWMNGGANLRRKRRSVSFLWSVDPLAICYVIESQTRVMNFFLFSSLNQGPFKYYVMKKVGGWGSLNDYVMT